MATEFCQKCKQAHPGRECDYDENGECSETVDLEAIAEAPSKQSRDKEKKNAG